MSTRIMTVLHGGIAAAITALVVAACDAHPAEPKAGTAAPSFASPPGSPVACLAKKSLAERVTFASADRAGKNLGRPDHWARQLSAFDRGARLRTLEPTTWREVLDHASQQGVSWASADEAYWGALVGRLSDALAGLNLKVPQSFMVTTTGLEEFNLAYVRNHSVVLPVERASLSGPVAGDERVDFFLLAHEFFHLLSGENPAQREALYGLLGFERHTPVRFEYPVELEDRRASQPSPALYSSAAHAYEYHRTVQTPAGPAEVVPVLRLTIPLEEVIQLPTSGPPAIGPFIEVPLIPIDTGTGKVLRDADGNPIIHGFGDTDWVPQMLRNSSYIIHPEELMADNFALLMEWRSTGILPTEVPGGPGAGFPVNDVDLLVAIEEILTAGCVG